MKTILLFLFACTATFAQEFNVTRGGLTAKGDNSQYYILESFEGIPADSLYANAKRYVQKNYGTLGNSIKTDDANKSVSFTTANVAMKTIKKGSADVTYLSNYTGNIEVKDGKAKIAYTSVDVFANGADNTKQNFPFTSYWNKKGKLVQPEIKKVVEDHFNASTRLIVAALKEPNTGAKTKGW